MDTYKFKNISTENITNRGKIYIKPYKTHTWVSIPKKYLPKAKDKFKIYIGQNTIKITSSNLVGFSAKTKYNRIYFCFANNTLIPNKILCKQIIKKTNHSLIFTY